MDAKTYVATYGKLSENTRRHECKICGSPIVWHALNIQQHLKIHKEMNLTLKSYYDSYISGREDDIPDNYSSAPSSRPSTSLSFTMSSDPNRWMNRCIFQCGHCAIKFDSRINFKSHVQNNHNVSYDTYLSNYGDPMISSNLHSCLMCNEIVTCDAEDIAEHLNIAHALSLEDYHDRFIANDRTIATAKKPNTLGRNWNQESQIHTCFMCSQVIEFSQPLLENHMTKNHGIDLRTYEKRFRHELDVIFDSFQEQQAHVTLENGDEEILDDESFGSVFEDDGEEEEIENPYINEDDPLGVIQSPDDIEDIDIEHNVDYITDEL